MPKHVVFLVPGFFGFTQLGSLNYFRGVADALSTALRARDIDASVVECATQPTGSIRSRADELLQQILAHPETPNAEHLHLVGHSTGGLDVRLLVTPGVRLRPGREEEQIGQRVRSVITVSTPHHGTPLANHFTTLQGRYILEILTLLATSKQGRIAVFAAAQSLALVARLDDWMGRRNTMLDWLAEGLLRRIRIDQDDPFWHFLRQVASDQGAIIQLTPEGMNLFDAAVTDRSGVDYRCVLTAAPAPIANELGEMLHPVGAAMIGLFAALHTLTAREHRHYPYPQPQPEVMRALQESLPFLLDRRANDGIVPSLSQVHGRPLAAVVADHLDVVGQYKRFDGDRVNDWLPSGAPFGDAEFVALWQRIADAIVEASA
jgi:hypothetical protein